ncbi:MAG: hypothetical protein KDK66_02960, partial [Deltaproteobacteria bacterium]|nr:hypothetical protein [Deltaproteobacteria bacterium]
QSGQIDSVGFELYTRLLEESVLELKGQKIEAAPEPELNLPWEANIPESYLPEMALRLSFYKQFSMTQNQEEIEDILLEMEDRFGPLPQEVQNLKETMLVKALAKRVWLKSLSFEKGGIRLNFDPKSPVEPESLMLRLDKEPGRFQWLSSTELKMGFKEGKEEAALESLKGFLLGLQLREA